MRITQGARTAICEILAECLHPFSVKVYLYGSRVHGNLKGGDIDLLVISDEAGVAHANRRRLDILVQLKSHSAIGDRRIDIKYATETELQTDPFLMTLHDELQSLHI